MITYKEYMKNSRELHQKFYAQFLTEEAIIYVAQYIGADKIVNSKDPHFNDIPLKLWDMLSMNLLIKSKMWKEAHDETQFIFSKAENVCLAKVAAFIIKERGEV